MAEKTTSPGAHPQSQQPQGYTPVVPVQPVSGGSSSEGGPQVVYLARPSMPVEPEIPEVAQRRHEESKRKYPELNLSKGEFVISAVRRHPIGLISIWVVTGIIVLLLLFIMGFLMQFQGGVLSSMGIGGASGVSFAALLLPFLGVVALIILGGFVSSFVYTQNKFFLTNESVVQFIQISLFSRKEQTISLANIEDASYRQHGIMQHLFGYGNIRLSTQGEETTYRFSYVANPRHQITLLNDAVEAFKNGRPIMGNEGEDDS
ncbi:PH domain-containing protein [Candidatus Saccharibacteria bacterium]|nr:PH domain-containing protein [Candidatus Saccharibacteria bacterium]